MSVRKDKDKRETFSMGAFRKVQFSAADLGYYAILKDRLT